MLSKKFARKALVEQEPKQRIITLANMLVEELIEQRHVVGHQYMPINVEIQAYEFTPKTLTVATLLSSSKIEGECSPILEQHVKDWIRIVKEES